MPKGVAWRSAGLPFDQMCCRWKRSSLSSATAEAGTILLPLPKVKLPRPMPTELPRRPGSGACALVRLTAPGQAATDLTLFRTRYETFERA